MPQKHQPNDKITLEGKVLRVHDDGRLEVECCGGAVQFTVPAERASTVRGAKHADDAEDVPTGKAARK